MKNKVVVVLTVLAVAVQLASSTSEEIFVELSNCCPESANYDPRADPTPCLVYGACELPEDVRDAVEYKSVSYVKDSGTRSRRTNLNPKLNFKLKNDDRFLKKINKIDNRISIQADACRDLECLTKPHLQNLALENDPEFSSFMEELQFDKQRDTDDYDWRGFLIFPDY